MSWNYRLALAILLLLCGLQSLAQTATGGLTGRIFDPQKAAVSDAAIRIKSFETGSERTVVSGSEGIYTFSLLPPGRYGLRVEVSGFNSVVEVVEVSVAVTTRADILLKLKRVVESTTVFGANGVAVQTENAELGTIIDRREITELPSVGRNAYDFIAVSPGANPSNDGDGVGFAVNGQRSNSGDYMLDGAENNNPFNAVPGQRVPLDSIHEYRLQANNYTAEFGRSSGFIANVVTKAGTNKFHGSLYDYVRNSVFASNSYENNAQGLLRPVFNRHQFGGTFGGPIQKQKAFFFGSLETTLVRSSAPTPFFVPTPQLLALSSSGVQALFQKYPVPTNLSTTNVQMRQVCPFGASCNFTLGSGLITLPAFAFTSCSGPQDAGAGPPQNSYVGTIRIDWLANPRTQLNTRYAFDRSRVSATASQPYSASLDQPSHGGGQNIALNLIRTWNPRWVTESRATYQRLTHGSRPSASVSPFPQFSFYNENVYLPSFGDVDSAAQSIYQFVHTATWAHGNHLMKFGGQYVHIRDNRILGVTPEAFFSDVQGFVDGVLDSYSIPLDPKGHLPGEQIRPPLALRYLVVISITTSSVCSSKTRGRSNHA